MVTKPKIYTREFVLSELNEMQKEILSDLGIFFIGQLFENRFYSRQRFSEWANEFKNDEEISDAIKRIEGLIETRLVTGGLTSALNPAITIFTLKNRHAWKDKTEQDLHIKELPKPILGGLSKDVPGNDSSSEASQTQEEN